MDGLKFTLLFFLFGILACQPKTKNLEDVQEETAETLQTITEQGMTKEEDKSIERPTINIEPHDKIVSPQHIQVNSQGVWSAHEGELGWIELIDEEGRELSKGLLMAEGEWMKEGPVMFSTVLTFDASKAEKGSLIVHNNPGPGEGDEAGEEKSFEIPVTLK